jgi:magnesium transporter
MKTKKHRRIIELVKEIEAITERGQNVHNRLIRLLADIPNHEVAAALDIHPENRLAIFKAVHAKRRSAVLDLVNGHTLRSIIGHLSDHEVAGYIETSPSIVCQKIISVVERPRLNGLLPLVNDEQRRNNLANYSNYPKRSVGRIMQSEMVIVRENMTVDQAINEIGSFNVFSGPVYQVYVVDEDYLLKGALPVAELLREAHGKKLKTIHLMKPPVITPLTTQQKAAQLFQEYDLIEAPIVTEGKLVGRVLVDDILDVFQQEFTEDIQKFAGITSEETMEMGVMQSSRRRLPWMIANIFLDLLAVSVIMPFEATIAEVTALAVLMPIVSDMGGNVGIQSLSVSVRALATNQPDWRLVGRELFKEARVGILNGLILGAILGVVAFVFWSNPYLGLIVAVALFINTIVASIIGGVLPIVLKRLNKDPAMMSGAVLTTVTDFCGFLVFLGMARIFIERLV